MYINLLITILHVIQITSCIKQKSPTYSCSRPSRLKEPEKEPKQINWNPLAAEISFTSPTLTTIHATRSLFRNYCYNGGNLDSNTGCSHSLVDKRPSCTEARNWVASDGCTVGEDCLQGGDCWGSWASKCIMEEEPTKRVRRKDFTSNHYDSWLSFPYHTCVKDWQCDFKTSETPIYMDIDSGVPTPVVLSPTSGIVKVSAQFINNGVTTGPNSLMCTILSEPPNVHTFSHEIHCLSSVSKSDILCQLPSVVINEEVRNQVIKINRNSLIGTLRNVYVKLLNVPQTITTVVTDFVHPVTVNTIPSRVQLQIGKAASIESIQEVAQSLLFLQMENQYNLLALASSVHDLQTMLTRLTRRLMATDSRLLGELLSMHLVTKQMTSDIFITCKAPAAEHSSIPGPNDETLTVSDVDETHLRELYLNDDQTSNSVCNLTLFENLTLITDLLSEPTMLEATSEETGWKWLEERKARLEYLASFTDSSGPGPSAWYSQVQQSLSIDGYIWQWFVKISVFLTWINAIVFVLFLRSK